MRQNQLPASGRNVAKKFLGQYFDDSTQLNYLQNRYLNAHEGRFTSEDPSVVGLDLSLLLDPQQMNFYSYGRGNPIRFTDADGKKVWDFQPYVPADGKNYAIREAFGAYFNTTIFSAGTLAGRNEIKELQCVDLVKRFANDKFNIDLGLNSNSARVGASAIDYANQAALNRTMKANNNSGYLTFYQNGGSIMPQENDVLVWSGHTNGHVGVVMEVNFYEKTGRGTVYTLEQNFRGQQAVFAQQFEKRDGGYFVEGRPDAGYNLQGWDRYGNQSTLPEYTSHTPATKPSTPAKK
jgi:RHS repeat-associated protein